MGQILITENRVAGNLGLTKVAVQCSEDTFVEKIPTFAKPETVTGKFKNEKKTKLYNET